MEIQISFHHLRWFKWKHRRFLSRWKTSFGLRRRLNILSFSREQIQTTRELYVDWYWIRFQIHFWFIYLNHCWSLSQHRCWKYCTRLFYLCFDLVYLVLVLLWDFLLSKRFYDDFYYIWWFVVDDHCVVLGWRTFYHFGGVGMVPCHRQLFIVISLLTYEFVVLNLVGVLSF